jgi:hypothetical protein
MIKRIAGAVYLVIGVLVLIGASQIPDEDHHRAVGYVAGGAFLAIGVWRLLAPKGH